MTSPTATVPVVDYLLLDGEPRLRGQRCIGCGAAYLERRNGCAQCGGRAFEETDLPRTGTLRTFTIVQRGRRGEPFISAVVALDDGTVVKANLVGVPPDAAQIPLGGPVELTTYPAGTDTHGTEAVAFGFRPA